MDNRQRTPGQIEKIRLQARITKRFHKACADYGLITDDDHILIGLSGGKDSLTLVELLGQRAQIHVPHFHVTAVHIRVKERAYLSDITYLQQFCQTYQVPLIVKDTEIGTIPNTDEHKTKDPCFLCSWYRRKALFQTAQELSCNKIALGHHQDDIIETLLLNLIFQGNIGTIAPRLQLDKMPIQMIRPLCLIQEKDLTRYAELSHYRQQVKLCPFEKDSSRTQIKTLLHQLEKLNPNVRDSVWGAMCNVKTNYLPQKRTN